MQVRPFTSQVFVTGVFGFIFSRLFPQHKKSGPLGRFERGKEGGSFSGKVMRDDEVEANARTLVRDKSINLEEG